MLNFKEMCEIIPLINYYTYDQITPNDDDNNESKVLSNP